MAALEDRFEQQYQIKLADGTADDLLHGAPIACAGERSCNRRKSSKDRDVVQLLDILSQLRPDLPRMHGCRDQDLEAGPRAAGG